MASPPIGTGGTVLFFFLGENSKNKKMLRLSPIHYFVVLSVVILLQFYAFLWKKLQGFSGKIFAAFSWNRDGCNIEMNCLGGSQADSGVDSVANESSIRPE